MLHTDIPTRAEVESLLRARGPWCVSIYLPTSPVTQKAQGDRIAFRNAIATALERLEEVGAPNDEVAAVRESLERLHDDGGFWAYQANSLAVFATASGIRTFRLPNRLVDLVSVSDRFHVKPLLRAVTFPQAAFVLALAQGSVRLLEVTPDLPAREVLVADMPKDAADAVGLPSIAGRSPQGRIQGSEGQKVRMGEYARRVDQALRSVLGGRDLPLILASTPPLDAIFRSVNSYPHLVAGELRGNPEEVSDAELAAEARAVLDDLYETELAELRSRFEVLSSEGKSATDLTDVARAATMGAVETALVDIDANLSGAIDEETGAVDRDAGEAERYGLTDEIARRVLLSRGHVLAVRSDEIPGGGPVAAILRYPV